MLCNVLASEVQELAAPKKIPRLEMREAPENTLQELSLVHVFGRPEERNN